MEYKIKIGDAKEYGCTAQDISDIVFACADGFSYWAEICCDDGDYEVARQRLQKRNPEDGIKPYYEDVLTEILTSGGQLMVYDREEDEDHALNLVNLLAGWGKYINDFAADDFDAYDSVSADCILQYAVFGEVVYG